MTASFITERQLAARLAVGVSTVQRWRTSGRIPFLRVGDVIRYRIADVENFEHDHFMDAVVVGLKRPSPIGRNR
jgi:excisionase family DNA binding protein